MKSFSKFLFLLIASTFATSLMLAGCTITLELTDVPKEDVVKTIILLTSIVDNQEDCNSAKTEEVAKPDLKELTLEIYAPELTGKGFQSEIFNSEDGYNYLLISASTNFENKEVIKTSDIISKYLLNKGIEFIDYKVLLPNDCILDDYKLERLENDTLILTVKVPANLAAETGSEKEQN
ncbi:TPA: hypothetical protein DEO28_04345 [Candidatus Dependentiae bacterium]|nr:MAG: hypothetical protein UR14_C0006G0106 [candidate division TM6 bacterium GW2011_GWE2_31_21]KKP53471.1 MAG: hypothetical protein UR43_C0004G0012 [candidate division TM6 bacterium GW2011_GWF2_33_332]HBS48287.1 hypothetical protein [Candidatus Dependentiae bacterium]HBZ73714.1 hypothetical protein [Candidatus Dependentiae bacterium]